MKIYLIMPVRGATESFIDYVQTLESEGHEVHYPTRDAPQDCPTGEAICRTHRDAMIQADAVHVLWDVESKGSHFDLGMAYALRKPIVAVKCLRPDPAGKSYWKAVCTALT